MQIKDVVYVGGALVGVTSLMAGSADAQTAFDGVYTGLSYGAAVGGPSPYSDQYSWQGGTPGIFGGYNFSSGDTVFGFDVAWQHEVQTNNIGGTSYSVANLTDVRARVGKTFGSTWVYGALGVSFGNATRTYGGGGSQSGNVSGGNVGVGFETNLGSGKYFVGGDVTYRLLNGQYVLYDSDLTTASVRVGMRF